MTVQAMPRKTASTEEIKIADWQQFARTYTPHPVAAMFPMLPPDELESLGSDICAFGLINPIVLDDEMRVVDGRNRLAAMLAEADNFDSVAPRFVRFDVIKPAKCQGVAEYIVGTNIRRRHLSDDQRAVIVAQAFDHYRINAINARSEKAKGNHNAAKNSGGETAPTVLEAPGQRTRDKVADAADVSEHKARAALHVVVDAPELVAQVAAGVMPLHAAAKAATKKAAAANPKRQSKPRKPKWMPLDTARMKVRNVIADVLGKLADEDMIRMRTWVAGGCK